MAKKAKARPIRDPQFAKRLKQAADDNPKIGEYNRGRLTGVRDLLNNKYKLDLSTETVRKWFAGEARPRPEKMKMLATVLECDLSWLSLGVAPEMEPRARDKRAVALTGAANALAGMVQMDGGVVAFPTEDDPRTECVHFFAIIKGAQYGIHAALAQPEDDGTLRFSVPTDHAQSTVIGVVKHDSPACDFIEIPSAVIDAHKTRQGGYNEVKVEHRGGVYTTGKEKLRKIKTFAERF